MATCQHCGQNPGPQAASEALQNAVGELRYYRLHRAFRLNEHPRTHHGAIRIELVRFDADRRSIRKVRRLALRQIARYWSECSGLRGRYRSRLHNWMNEVQAELERRDRVRRRRLAGSRAGRG